MHDLPETADGNAFLKSYVSTKAFHDDPTPLLHAFEHHTGPFLPLGEVVLAVCDLFAGPFADSSRDMSTSVAGDAMHVAPLLLRLYEQAQGSGRDDVQDRCLDAWDRLLKSRVGDVGKIMETIGQ